MGLLVDGVWQQDGLRTKDGHFIRPTAALPQLGDAGRQRRPFRRRRLCRRARPLSPLRLARLPMGAPHHHLPQAQGAGERDLDVGRRRPTCARMAGPSTQTRARAATPSTARARLSEIYLLADPKYTGRVSVPVLWDKKRKTIVNNESSEIIRMLNSAFDAFTNVHTDYYPQSCAPRSTASTSWSIRTSTTASIAPASPPRRTPTRKRSATCSTRSTRSSRCCRAAALSRRRDRSPRPTGGCSRR